MSKKRIKIKQLEKARKAKAEKRQQRKKQFPTFKKIFKKRKCKAKKGEKGYVGERYRANIDGLNGSRHFHNPSEPKIDMFVDPDAIGVKRNTIGRYISELEETQHKAFPLILLRAAHVISHAFYYNPLDYSATRDTDEDGNTHQVYSQRREAIAKLSGILIMKTDLSCGRVGKYGKDGVFYDISLKNLASLAGIGYERAKRAMRVLKEKGYITVSKVCQENEDGSFSGHVSIKRIAFGFWDIFGFGKWFEEESKTRYRDNKIKEARGDDLGPQPKIKAEKVMKKMGDKAAAQYYAGQFLNNLNNA